MIGRIQHRRDFQRLQRLGRRRRSGSLWCTSLEDADAVPPRVAFALGRSLGSAVARNRLRRRLRAIARDLATTGTLAPGWYLIGARSHAVEQSFDQLSREVRSLVEPRSSTIAP